jgi:DNA-binding NtrC family response regulator
MRAGAYDFIAKPFDAATIQLVVRRALETRGLKTQVHNLRKELDHKHLWVRGADPGMARVAETVERVATSNATVLLLGETGTGKEVIARALHLHSTRRDQPFVAVNCAVLKGELLESELFGHEKGAFTGADRARPGRVEDRARRHAVSGRDRRAAAGSAGQAAARAAGEGIRAARQRPHAARRHPSGGGDAPRPARCHPAGTFRDDLYYRLKVISIKIPPLRERPIDILPLAEWLLDKHASESARTPPCLSAEVRQALQRYPWPGNVRELSNVMERFVLLAGDTVGLCDLPEELTDADAATSAAVTDTEELFALGYNEASPRPAPHRHSRARTGGLASNPRGERLGVTQPYLSRLVKQLGIRRDES